MACDGRMGKRVHGSARWDHEKTVSTAYSRLLPDMKPMAAKEVTMRTIQATEAMVTPLVPLDACTRLIVIRTAALSEDVDCVQPG